MIFIVILRQKVSATIGYSSVFLSTQKSKKVDKKWNISRKKFHKLRNSKNGVQTAQRLLLKELGAILEKKTFSF